MTTYDELFNRKLGISASEERRGALHHYHLPGGYEIAIYPLLYGRAVLCCGRINSDQWDRGYEYATPDEAYNAAIGWIDIRKQPPGDWTHETTTEHGRTKR